MLMPKLMIMRVGSGWQVINLADLRQKIEEGQIDARQLITMKTLKVPPPPLPSQQPTSPGRNRQKLAVCVQTLLDSLILGFLPFHHDGLNPTVPRDLSKTLNNLPPLYTYPHYFMGPLVRK